MYESLREGSASAEPVADTVRPPRNHRPHRPGFHWQTPWDLAPYVVYAPVPWDTDGTVGTVDRRAGAAESGFAGADAPGFGDVTGRLGRDGRIPVAHVDILLHLDAMAPGDRTAIGLPSGESLVSTMADSTVPLLHHCAVREGALSLAGSGSGRCVTWEPGTTLLVEDLPRTSVDSLPLSWYTTARSSDGDPADALRREAFFLLGTRYHSDIPPAPRDALSVEFAWQDRPGHEHVPTEYPGWADSAEVFLEERMEEIVVRRFGSAGPGTQYVLPATADRRDLIRRMREEYLYSVSAYASVGADQGAADTLVGTVWSPVALRELLPVMAVRNAVDASCLISRPPDRWRRQGWPVDATDGSGPRPHRAHSDAEPRNAWSASQAEVLASAGITAERARELRSAGCTTVPAALAGHATRPTAAAREAGELLGTLEFPVPARVTAELKTARQHGAEEVRSWGRDHRVSCGIEGWGVWVTLTRHDFVLTNGGVHTLWDVTNGWWAISDEGDEGQSRCVFTDVRQALSVWRTTRAELRAYEARFLADPPALFG